MSKGLNMLNNFIEEKLYNLHTATVAKVVKVNSGSYDVQPLIMTKEFDESRGERMPLLINVPALSQKVFLDGVRKTLTPAYQVGDVVFISFGERAIDYAITGREALPADFRRHSLNDAVILGVFR